jgi:Carboxypeptidase regulatory-like domain/Dockerin type I domain
MVSAEATDYLTVYYDGVYTQGDATPVGATEGQETANIDFVLIFGNAIAGTVTNMAGDSLENCLIEAVSWDDEEQQRWNETDSDGAYDITHLPPGNYRVSAWCEDYLGEYYDDALAEEDATSVAVVEGQDTLNIDFALQIGGTISGVVTDSLGNPLEDCDIDADSWESEGGWGYGYTDVNGFYTITGLATGDYRVDAHCDGYVEEYYDGVRNWDDATPVHIIEGQEHPDIDFSLTAGGSVSGTVLDVSDNPLDDCDVYADPWDGSGSWGEGWTDGAGFYTISGLPTGNYRVSVWCDSYASEYYDNVSDWEGATAVHIVEGQQTPDINFSLEREGTISGTVEDVHGNPIEDTEVCAEKDDRQSCEWTDEDGYYTIYSLAPGNYIVNAKAGAYVREYYDDVRSRTAATAVSVVSDQDTDGIDFVLDVGGTITARVSDADDNPITNAWVSAGPSQIVFSYAASPPIVPVDGGRCFTTASGQCTISGLATGEYIVSAGGNNLVTSYFDGATSKDEADPVSVAEGANTQVGLTPQPVSCGDADEGGSVGMVDAMRIAQSVAGLIDHDSVNAAAADVNSAGGVSMVDAMLVAQYVAGVIDHLSCNLPSSGP